MSFQYNFNNGDRRAIVLGAETFAPFKIRDTFRGDFEKKRLGDEIIIKKYFRAKYDMLNDLIIPKEDGEDYLVLEFQYNKPMVLCLKDSRTLRLENLLKEQELPLKVNLARQSKKFNYEDN